MPERSDLLITAAGLATAIAESSNDGPRVRLLDVRWRLDRPDGHADYRSGHIPGAVYVDLDRQLADIGDPRDGRHPLPTVGRLQEDARGWGIDDGDDVVVYDDFANLSAARAWWLLRHAGVRSVRMLDGGLSAWATSGRALEQGEVAVEPGNVALEYGHLPVVDMDEAARVASTGILLDARAGERYRGETEPMDPRAGHIPGAVNTPTAANVDEAGRFRDATELAERFAAAGVTDRATIATYCGSGVNAAHNVAALMLAGFEPALYPGSWSQWSNHPDRPVATGDESLVLPAE